MRIREKGWKGFAPWRACVRATSVKGHDGLIATAAWTRRGRQRERRGRRVCSSGSQGTGQGDGYYDAKRHEREAVGKGGLCFRPRASNREGRTLPETGKGTARDTKGARPLGLGSFFFLGFSSLVRREGRG